MAGTNKLTKKQHYLPKAYLRFFSHQERRTRKLYAHFCSEKVVRYIPIDDICQRPFLYEQKITIPGDPHPRIFAPNEIENSFIEGEGEYVTIIERIIYDINRGELITLNDAEKRKLVHFMSTILFREPLFVHIVNCCSEDEYPRHPELFADVKAKYPKMSDSVFRAAYAHKNLAYYLNLLAQAMSDTTIGAQMVVLKTMSSIFVTSDRPVVNIYGETDGKEYDLIGLPITPNLFLAFVTTDTVLPPVITVDDKQVISINNRQLKNQSRYIFSNQENISRYIELTGIVRKTEDVNVDVRNIFSDDDIEYYEKIMSLYKLI